VVLALLWDDSATHAPDTLDFERWLLAGDAHASEGMFAEGVESLKETLEQVLSLIHDLTLALVLIVLQEPESIALLVEDLKELIDTSTSLIWVIDEEGLEVEEVPWRLWQQVQWVLFLLLFVALIVVVLLWLSSSRWLWSNFLLLDLNGGLHALGAALDVTVGLNDCFELRDALKPGRGLGSSLAEATIQNGLEERSHQQADAEVSDGWMSTDEPVTREVLFNLAAEVLSSLAHIVALVLSDLSDTKDRVDQRERGGDNLTDHPVAPLVDLSALNVVGTEKRGVAVGEVLGDGDTLIEVAFGGLEHGELSGDALGLDFSQLALRYDHEFDVDASV